MRPILLLLLALLSKFSISQNEVLSVFFEKNSSSIADTEAKQLRALKQRLDTKEILILRINAYCDTTGTVDFNQKLAERRLSSVVKNLRLSPNNTFSAMGENITFDGNRYDAKEHRRVDIIYTKLTAEVFSSGGSSAKKQELASILTTSETELTVDFNFEFISGTATLANLDDPELNELTQFLKKNTQVKAHIRGHVCCSDNQLISEQRAEAIYQYLTYSGVSKQQLSFKGYSNTLPSVTPEITEADKQKNRRVDVVLSK